VICLVLLSGVTLSSANEEVDEIELTNFLSSNENLSSPSDIVFNFIRAQLQLPNLMR
jgi:hypothetical protein